MSCLKRIFPLLLLVASLLPLATRATHVVGGEIYYKHLAGNTYEITLIVYQECGTIADVVDPPLSAYPVDNSATITVIGVKIADSSVSTKYIPNPCLQSPATTCLRKKVFRANSNLPPGKGGYDLNFEIGNRSTTIINLNTAKDRTSIFYCFVPDLAPKNSSPSFPNDPPPNLCIGDTVVYPHYAIDSDGDSIAYKWCNPKGVYNPDVGVATPGSVTHSDGAPYPDIPWNPGYAANDPVPSNPPFTINPKTGEMIGIPNTLGNFVYSVCYEEYRNGVLIGEGSRDYMFRVTNCSPRVPKGNTVAQGGASNLGYCSDMTVNFVNTSTDAESYYWDFGDALITTDTSTQKEPTYTYNQAGNYTIMLIANPSSDCADTTTIDYEIYPEIDIYFLAPNAVCFTGGLFDFETLGKFDPSDTFEWDFGALAVEQYSNDQNPTGVMFTEPGFHNVTLKVSNATCSSTYSEIVEVLDSPDPTFDKPEDQCINGNNHTFIAKGDYGPNAEILWVFGSDANRDSVTSPTAANIVYASVGRHDVSLFVTENGCTIEYTDFFYIVLPPVAEFKDLSAKQCLNINSYDFWPTGTASDGATYQWHFGNFANPNSATTDTVWNVTFFAPGTYTITLTVEDGGCSHVYQDQIEIVEAPQAYANAQAPQCILGNSFDFQGAGIFGPNSEFLWVFGPDANTDSTIFQNENNVSFSTSGIHRVSFTVTENGCPDTYFIDVEVTPEPKADFSFIADQCISNGPFDFMFEGVGGKYATYQWSLPPDATILSDSNLNSISIPEVSFSDPGSHTVQLTVSENGCVDTYTQTFGLTASPIASFNPMSPQCLAVNSFNFTNTGTFGVGATLTWNFGPDASPMNSSDVNPVGVEFSTAKYHVVTLSITEFGCTDVYSDSVLVTPTPAPFYAAADTQCVDSNSFNFISVGSYSTDATYLWDFGPNSTPANATTASEYGVTYSKVGVFPVTLTINEYGCSETYTSYVNITAAPVPFFTHPITRCVSANSYNFIAGGSFGNDATFSWNFGPNTNLGSGVVIAQGVNQVTFNSVGDHTITLTISENGCTYTYTDIVTITPEPVPFINSVNNQCVNNNNYNFDLTGSSYGDSAKFYWDFGPNCSVRYDSTIAPPSVSFTAVGTQTVTLTIEENGCTFSTTINVNITAPPSAAFGLNNTPNQQCISINSFDFATTGAYGSAASFIWDFGPNTTFPPSTNSAVAGVVFNTVGWQYISLTVSENGCSNSYTDSVLVTAVPSATTANVTTQCVNNNNYNFYGMGTYGPTATFEWNFAGAANPNIVNTLDALGVTFNTAGTHNITFSISENGCTDTYTLPVTITPSPDATFTVNAIDQCFDNQSFDFSIVNTGPLGPNATYDWQFGPNANIPNSASAQPSGISFNDSGHYQVTLTVQENGCIHYYAITVNVFPLPIPDFTANQAGCEPLTVNFQNTSYAWTPMTYFWDFGDGQSSTNQHPTHVYNSPGVYTVVLTVTVASSDPCPGDYSTSKTNFITVYPSPNPGFDVDRYKTNVFDPIITVTNTSTDATSMTYDFGDGTVITNPVGGAYAHTYTNYGVYNITQTVTNQFGCVESHTIPIEIEAVYRFYAPNAFTPNADGTNNVYRQSGIGFENGVYILNIYTRWGEQVFSTTDIKVGWDGFDEKNNTPAPEGNYIYLTKIIDNYGVPHDYRGTIALIR